MRSDKSIIGGEWLRVLPRRSALFLGLIGWLLLAGLSHGDVTPGDFAGFLQAVERGEDAQALSIGEPVFAALKRKYVNDSGFRAFESRLKAAEFLAGQMQQQLSRAAGANLFATVSQVAGDEDSRRGTGALTIAPAKRFYETSVKVFSNAVRIAGLSDDEQVFLTRYYDLRLKSLVAGVAKAGQSLAIADPSFRGTHDYALVLPLLHVLGGQPVNSAVLPLWMQQRDQLNLLADSCLFHFELPFQAMVMARRAAEFEGVFFSEPEFYRSAAHRCGRAQARVAVSCLDLATTYIAADQEDAAVSLKFDVIQIWLDSGNFPLAAGEARSLFEKYPDHAAAGKVIWLYYYALSRSNSTEEILAGIDKVLADSRCAPFQAKLMYIKWWALRRQRNQSARVAALEHELLKLYGDDPMVAPILLSRATDLLASQSYNGATEILQQLVQKFPSTQAAAQARRMLERLKDTRDVK